MEQGWIYVLVNSSIPGLAKIGRTSRPPVERAAELSAATGVATAFVVAFEQEFADCVAAEQAVHQKLDRLGLRAAPNREFFRGSPAELVRVILTVAATAPMASQDCGPSPTATSLLARGDMHLFGIGEALQDLPEAVRCYRLAAARGSIVALERLGVVHAGLRPRARAERRRAMHYLKEGVRRGNYYCYCEMAALFLRESHVPNFAKAWDLFFARRGSAFRPETEDGEDRYPAALRAYVAGCLELGLAPGHLRELRAAADSFVDSVVVLLTQMQDAPGSRESLAGLLRWAYEALSPQTLTPSIESRRRWLTGWLSPPTGAPA